MARLGPTGLTQVFTDIKNWVNSKLSTKADTAHTHTAYAVKHTYTTAVNAAKNWYRIANANTKQVYTGNPIHAEFILTAYNSSYDAGYSERWYVRAMVLGRNAHVTIFGSSAAPFNQCRVLYENTIADIDDNDRPAIDIYLNYVLANGTTKIEIEEVYNQGWTFVADGQLAASTVPTGFENTAVSIRGNGVERSTYSDIATYLNKPRRDITSNVTLADNNTYRSTTLNCTGTRTITLPSINSNYFWCVIKNFNAEAGIITIHPSTTAVLIDGSNDDIVLRPGEFVAIHSRAANSFSIVGDNRKRTCLVGRSGGVGTDTKHWFRVAQKTLKTGYRDAFILLDVFQAASDSNYMGRLCAHVRVDGTVGVVGNKQFSWLYRGTQLSDADFAMTTIETSGTSVVVDIWCKRTDGYSAFAFVVVSEGFSTDSLDSPAGKWILTRQRATVGDLESLDTGFTTVTNPTVVTLANSITGNAGSATTAQQVRKDPAAGSTADLLYSQCAGTDIFRLQVGGASNAGYAEIATADDGSEPIYVRQYKGAFTSLQRTAALLDGLGNTSFPGQVTGATFNGPLTWNDDTLSYTANHSLYFYSGQPAIANCFEGSSNDFTKFSYPAGGTAVSSINANIQTLRLDWGNTYWHDIFVSPNQRYIWHRDVRSGTANPWARIVEENVTGLTDQSWNINIAGTATNVTGTVTIAHGGTGATTRLDAVKALTNEAVSTPTYFLTITNGWAKAGYTTVAQAKTVLGITGDIVSHNASEFLTTSGNETVTGTKIFNGDKIVITQGNGYRMVCNTDGGSSGYGVFQRVDSANWYLMVTAQNDALGSWTSARPASMNLSTGVLSINGNAATATQFSANKDVTLTGDVTGTASSKAGWSVATTLANSGVTAGTYGPSADVTGNNNATISVPEITVDAKGRVTSVTNRTLTCKNNTYNVYNKTLTIQKNGTNVATFTSNSNTNVTANITVPTKVSELTNDSGYLTAHQSLSNYVTLNTAQEITNTKTFKDANTVVKRTDIEAGNTLPSADKLARNIFQDKNGKELGSIYYYKNTSGNTGLCLRAGDWFSESEGVYSLNASGTNRRAELVLYTNSSGDCCIQPNGYFSSTLKALSTSVWLGESTKPFGRVYADNFKSCNAGLLPDTDVQTTEEHSIGFYGQNNTPLSYITFQKRPNLKDRVAIRVQTSSSSYKSYDFDATCFYPESSNSVDIGSTTNIFKNIYCNNYYKGTTAFGDIVTHNASEFLTAHQSLDNYVTTNTSQTITAIKIITGGNQGKMVFKNPDYTKGDAVESGTTISRLYFGNGASYAAANGVLTTDVNSSGNTSVELCAMENTANSSVRASLILTYDKSATSHRLLKSWGNFLPYVDNTYTLGNSSSVWKECYCNAYYLGTTAFGDIVTHNASEFLTSHPSITLSSNTTSTASPAHGGTFTCIDSVTQDTNGHITKVNTKTITLPADSNTDTKVTQTVTTDDSNYPVLLCATADATTTGTTTSRFSAGLAVNTRYSSISMTNKYDTANTKGVRDSTKGYLNGDIIFRCYDASEMGRIHCESSKNGYQQTYMQARSYIKNGAISPEGTATTCYITVRVRDNGSKTIYTDGSWENSLTPYKNETYDLGTSSLRWMRCYCKNFYGSYVDIAGRYLENEFSINARTCLYLKSNRDTDGKSGIYFSKFRQNKAQGALTGSDLVCLSLDVLENSVRTNNCISISFRYFENDVPTKIYVMPKAGATSYIGTADNPWTNVYGVNFYENGTALSSKYAQVDNISANGIGTTRLLAYFPANTTDLSLLMSETKSGTSLYVVYWRLESTASVSGDMYTDYNSSLVVNKSQSVTGTWKLLHSMSQGVTSKAMIGAWVRIL